MRQPVVITLIVVGALLITSPLVTGAYLTWVYAQAAAQLGGSIYLSVPGQDWFYPWACFGAGILLIAIGVAGEWLWTRRTTGDAAKTIRAVSA